LESSIVSKTRPFSGSSHRRLAAAFLGAAVLAACGNHATTVGSQAADEPIPECEQFLAAYEHCLDSLGPVWIAQARIEKTRAAFATEAAQGAAAGQALRTQCIAQLSQLRTTCR
jgi:hypothetical protein